MPTFRALATLALISFSPNLYVHGLQTSGDLPSYALTYAPIVHLSSRERFWPSDPAVHLQHVTAKKVNFSDDAAAPRPLTLSNLNYPGSNNNTWLTSNDDVSKEPEWLLSNYGKPDNNGKSAALPAIIAIDKTDLIGPGYVDIYYAFFYSYNRGNTFNNAIYGDHVSDWESLLIRFLNGKPQAIHYSQHSDGTGYTYAAVPKEGLRPITYCAEGSHANYATVGSHPRLGGAISDRTEAGPGWDITLNYAGYWYSAAQGFVATTGNKLPTGWLEFLGNWGDQQYPDSDPRQRSLAGLAYRYTNGVPGPIGHNLLRKTLCQSSDCPANTNLNVSTSGSS